MQNRRCFPQIKGESGSALLISLMVVIIVAVTFLAVLNMNQTAERQMYMVRYRNQMNTFESRWRSLLQESSSYQNCTFDTNTCELKPTVLANNKSLQLLGGGCPPPEPNSAETGITCGFTAAVVFDPTARTATLAITPVGFKLKPLQAIVAIPNDILQLNETSCPLIDPTKPLFKGIDTNGHAICLPLPKPECDTDVLRYAVGINHVTGAIICRAFPTTTVGQTKCPLTQFIESFSWEAGQKYEPGKISCVDRLSPFSLFIYDPSAVR